MYSGPSPRNLVISVLLHGSAITALFNVSLPVKPPPDALARDAQPSEIRIRGTLYYVAEIDGSRSGSSSAPSASNRPPDPKIETASEGRAGGIAAPRAAAAGRSPKPAPPATPAPGSSPELAAARAPAPAASPAPATTPAPNPLPQKIRSLRQEARAFIPPEVHPTPTATQTLIQPLSPNVAPPPTPLPNFRVFTDLRQVRIIPKPFQAPGRRTPPTPPQAPDFTQPALELVPQPPAPVGDPFMVLSLNDHPIPLSEEVVVPPGNVAQPPAESSGPATAPGGAPGTNAVGSGAARTAATGAKAASPGGPTGSTSNGSAGATGGSATGGGAAAGGGSAPSGFTPGNGRAAVGSGSGAALVGGSPDGSLVAIVGGNGASPGNTGAGTGVKGLGMNGAGASATAGTGSAATGAGTGVAPAAGTGVSAGTGVGAGSGSGTGSGAGPGAPGPPTINRPPPGAFDAMVVQSSPVDQYPESRGLLSGRPIYSVYLSMGTARDWTLFFCVAGEKPESADGPVVVLSRLGAPVKAPYPTKLIKPAITLPSYEKYVLVHGMVNKDGKFESLRLVRSIKPETDQAVLAALGAWEFRAATRDGVAIAVEFLLSIPAKGL